MDIEKTSRFSKLIRYTPLPLQSMFVGLVCGLIVWVVLDFVQSRALKEILGPQFAAQLEQRAGENLLRLDGYLQRYKLVVQLLALNENLIRSLGKSNWNIEGPILAKVYEKESPPWLLDKAHWPALLKRGFLVLVDEKGYTQEVFPIDGKPFPQSLNALNLSLQLKARDRPFIIEIDKQPYFLTAHSVSDVSEKNHGGLMLITPIDADTLIDSQQGFYLREYPLRDTVIALLGSGQRVLTSSAIDIMSAGSGINEIRNSYNLSGRFPFEYGSEGDPVEFAVLFSQQKFDEMSEGVLMLERQQRIAASLIFVAVFTAVISLISIRTNRLLKRIENFSREALDIKNPNDVRGNQLVLIEDRVSQLIRAVMSSREQLNKRHAIELRESNALKAAVLSAALDCIITINRVGEILEFNPASEKMFGFTYDEATGKDMVKMIIPSEYRAGMRQHLVDGAESLEGRRAELVAMRRNGESFPVEFTVSPIQLEGEILFTVYLHDITERKKAEEEIHSLAKFPGESPSAVMRVNHHGVIIYVNDASKPLLDYWACSIGQTLPIFWKQYIVEALEKHIVKETELICDGQIISLQISPVKDLGYVNIYGRDVTEVRKAEEISRQHQAELVHVCRLSTMGEMATGLAHELNQPLAAIVNYASGARHRLIEGIGDPAQVLGAMDQVSRQAERAGEIIRRMRGMVGKRESLQDQIDANALIQDALSFVTFEVAKAEVMMQTELADAYMPIVVDSVQIEQVLHNLIRNASEAMRDAGSKVRELLIRTEINGDNEVVVSIKDTGPGISQEVMDHLFDPFFTTKDDGMGMGLSISQTIINNHEGKLWATHNADQGTTFYFTLPLAKGVRRYEV